MRRILAISFFAVSFLGASGALTPASAQIVDLTFDRWCMEDQGWDKARCSARSEEDMAAFAAYRDTVERYESEFRREQEDRAILRSRVDTQGNTTPETSREPGE